jgi:hypothetical protein
MYSAWPSARSSALTWTGVGEGHFSCGEVADADEHRGEVAVVEEIDLASRHLKCFVG